MNKNRKHDEQVCSWESPFGTTYLLEFFVFGLKMGLFENIVTRNKVKILYFEKVQFETTLPNGPLHLVVAKMYYDE